VLRLIFNHMVEYSDAAAGTLDEVFRALADPTRRAILAMLQDAEANVGDIATRFPISLNGVSKHLRVLERAGLIAREVRGREHRLRLEPVPLADAAAWLNHYRAFWTERLESLEAFLVDRKKQRASSRRRKQS
jgi:DNA-binding transcriptional ArsR family regulator